ncbi:alpha/beta hydrolase [Parahaliea maris]|uniref:Monoacylglycerol lipase n=1 Tax=Parahaliea maris TaxID=2716870 RepID=A0A5C8ZYW1_9GAMM|nr:alpha/beta hydrolase [Parahaliea maris]TXS93658.1 alpha/beta hydrolase [Parahaliea maris]
MTQAEASPEVTPEEGHLSGGIYYRHWHAVGEPRAVILMVHGLGEHSGRYQGFADFFCPRGYAVVAPDHVGHGQSPGHRVYVERFADFLEPLEELRQRIGEWYPQVPCVLVGHSMGGLIVARYLLDHQQDFMAAALSGAALGVDPKPAAPLLWINALLSRLFPKMGLMQLDATEVCRDPEVVRRYIEDPLVHDGKVTARLVSELFSTMAEVEARRPEITLPIMVMHGEGDVMTSPSGSLNFVEGVASGDKTLRLYPGLFHEIFNEPERLEVLGELESWLSPRVS